MDAPGGAAYNRGPNPGGKEQGMPRRREMDPEADYGYEEQRPYPRARRRRSSNVNGVLIALAIAGVVGIVFFFIVTSGASGEQEIAAAKNRMRELFETFVKDQPKRGSELIDPRQILADTQKAEMKGWNEMSEATKQEKRVEAWRFLKSSAEAESRPPFDGLNVKTMADADQLMDTMTFVWNPALRVVEAKWDVYGKPWRARIQKNSDGSFTIIDFKLWNG